MFKLKGRQRCFKSSDCTKLLRQLDASTPEGPRRAHRHGDGGGLQISVDVMLMRRVALCFEETNDADRRSLVAPCCPPVNSFGYTYKGGNANPRMTNSEMNGASPQSEESIPSLNLFPVPRQQRTPMQLSQKQAMDNCQTIMQF